MYLKKTATKQTKYENKVPEDQNKSTDKKIDMDKLNPEEWLDDLIINEYCMLLSKQFGNNVFIFSTFFLESLKRSGYQQTRRWIKNENLFLKKYIFFPLHEKSHWFLAVYENESSTFVVYDPYNEAQDSESKYEKEHKKIKQKCMESMRWLGTKRIEG